MRMGTELDRLHRIVKQCRGPECREHSGKVGIGSNGMALHRVGSTGWVSVGLHGLAMEGRWLAEEDTRAAARW